jgi:hypothetical protein
MHHLQQLFAEEANETAWAEDLHVLFAAGDFAETEAVLGQGLAELGSDLAAQCLALRRRDVVLTGWDALDEAVGLHEGDPITGVTIAIANEYDRAFEKGELHHPYVTLGLYSDEGFAFSRAGPADYFGELEQEYPAWAGFEEDIEVHLDIEGLDALNTALIHHRQRHFFRDGRPAEAPARYVEYVLACWWRALRWHQAVERVCGVIGLPGAVPVVCGMVEMRPEVVSLHVADGYAGPRPRSARVVRAPLAEAGFGEGFIRRGVLPVEEVLPSGLALRRRTAEAQAASAAEPARPRLFNRLLGREPAALRQAD